MNKGWKFQYHKAIGDYALTNAERATLTAIWDYADAKTGKCYPTDAQINEKCNRSAKTKISHHKKKFVELGLLTMSGHGRKSVYFLNKSVIPVRRNDSQVRQDDVLSPLPRLTNRSKDISMNTSTKEQEDPSDDSLGSTARVEPTEIEEPENVWAIDYYDYWAQEFRKELDKEASK